MNKAMWTTTKYQVDPLVTMWTPRIQEDAEMTSVWSMLMTAWTSHSFRYHPSGATEQVIVVHTST